MCRPARGKFGRYSEPISVSIGIIRIDRCGTVFVKASLRQRGHIGSVMASTTGHEVQWSIRISLRSLAALRAGSNACLNIVTHKPKNADASVDDASGWRRVFVRTKGTDGAVITVYHYICLPDPGDPRGPKGK